MTTPPPASAPAGRATPQGVQIPLAELVAHLGGAKGYARLLGALTVTERPQPGRPKASARARRFAYYAEGAFLYVPRTKAAALLGRRVLSRLEPGGGAPPRPVPPPLWAAAQPFYAYQEAAADFVCAPAGPFAAAGAAYVQMGTGMGKTRFGLAVAARAAGPVFVAVPTEAIRLQWLDEFAAVFPRLRCGAYANPPKGSRRAPAGPETHDAVVGIFNTVRAKPGGFLAGYATVILDEAHELHSPKNLRVLWLALEAPRVLGISATPFDRADGLDRVVAHFLGPPVVAERDIPDFDVADVCFRGRVREVEYAGDPAFCETAVSAAGTVSAIETVGNLVRDPARLRLVAAEVERLFRLHEAPGAAALGLGPRPAAAAAEGFPEGGARAHGVFVFAEHREYLPALRAALLERLAPGDVEAPELDADGAPGPPGPPNPGLPPNSSTSSAGIPVVLRGGATRAQLGDAHRARVVLTTYGFSRRGISLVDMTAIVLASPRRNGMRQILGRVTRRGSDESILRLVVDIKDVRTALKSQSTERRKVYKEKGYPIYRVRAGFEEFAAGAPAAPPTEAEALVWSPDGAPPGPAEPGAAAPDGGGELQLSLEEICGGL